MFDNFCEKMVDFCRDIEYCQSEIAEKIEDRCDKIKEKIEEPYFKLKLKLDVAYLLQAVTRIMLPIKVNYTPVFIGSLNMLGIGNCSFSECACRNFNRTNGRRLYLENRTIDILTRRFSPLKTPQINYVGFGCGGMLQDLINICKIAMVGYDHLDVTLIEKDEREFNWYENKQKVFEEIARQTGCKITTHKFTQMDECIKKFPQKKYHVVSAIDMMKPYEACSELSKIHNKLHQKGILCLATYNDNYFINRYTIEDAHQYPMCTICKFFSIYDKPNKEMYEYILEKFTKEKTQNLNPPRF